MKILKCLVLLAILPLFATSQSIYGVLQSSDSEGIPFANVALYKQADSSLVKVEVTDDSGTFRFQNLVAETYYLSATYVGYADMRLDNILLNDNEDKDLGTLQFESSAVELEAAIVTTSRAMVEVKPDRTVFNVEGTINSAGDNGLGLLRKAPGVLVDNNDNITVLSRSGVLLYVDGKRLPLTGEDLTNYLRNLTAEQIDRIEVITNPGARYEAEGNAGIIDIRLKKNENFGANGSLSGSISQGVYNQRNINATGNYRNSAVNVFGSLGASGGDNFNEMEFLNYQNGLFLDETTRFTRNNENYNYRAGLDFFLNEQHTFGFLVSGRVNDITSSSYTRNNIATQANPTQIDSILIADNQNIGNRDQNTFNINYRFQNKNSFLNVDADYGRYRNESALFQPNLYFDAAEENVISENINSFDTPTDIDIATFKLDYETKLAGGRLGLGSKLSRVITDNTFLFMNVLAGEEVMNDRRSNRFEYDESVYAGYVSYARKLGEKWNVSLGLRAEQTDATGDLQAFLSELQEPPVELNYLSWFPSLGLTYQLSQQNTLAFNYGRRINRPDYNVLNPFNIQWSELSFEKGNPFLSPEIVNNFELGYTLAYRYNFKLAYSRTTDQITRLIGPDENDPRAGFITWDNLATQSVYSANISAPIQVTKGWNAYMNLNGSYIDNQANYGNGAIVDVQAWSYNIFQQHTIDLPKGFKGEVSGWFSGPGVWGGVFEYDVSWSLNLGLQRKFLQDQLNVRLSVNDIFYETGWSGTSEFNGLISEGRGNWDSRRASLSVSYNFGNQKVKSRKRKTGLEEESKRVGG